MADIEKVKQGVKACLSEHWCHKCFNCPYKPDRDNDDACVERLGADVLELLKEREKKPLRCKNCSYHRNDEWCNEHGREVKETDYCSFGVWKE